jgi:membrane protease YdiL (CAAX protease family)
MIATGEVSEFPDRRRAALATALLLGVLAVTVGLPVLTAWRRTPVAIATLGIFDLFAIHIMLALFLTAWFVLQRRASARAFLALPAQPWGPRLVAGLKLGVLGWLLTVAAMVVLTLATKATETEPGAPPEEFVGFITWLARRPFGLRLALVLTAMTVEEAFFRAFLQPRIGIALATLAFALGHVGYGSPQMGAGVLVIGLVLALDFRRRGDLAVCAIAHGVFDAIQLLIVLPLAASQL